MKYFIISQTSDQLSVTKKPGSTILLAGMTITIIIGVIVGMIYVIVDPGMFKDKNYIFWISILAAFILAVEMGRQASIRIKNACQGDTWIFDRSKQLITHVNKIVARFDEIESIELEDDNGTEGRSYYLSLITVSQKKILVENMAYNLHELSDVAKHIASFMNVPMKLVTI